MTIESRYKIEYIYPDDDKKKSPSKPLLFLSVIALSITGLAVSNDYTLENILNDSIASSIENTKEEASSVSIPSLVAQKTNAELSKESLSTSNENIEYKLAETKAKPLKTKQKETELIKTVLVAKKQPEGSTTSIVKTIISNEKPLEIKPQTIKTTENALKKQSNFIAQQEKTPLILSKAQTLSTKSLNTPNKLEINKSSSTKSDNSNQSAVNDIIATMKASENK